MCLYANSSQYILIIKSSRVDKKKILCFYRLNFKEIMKEERFDTFLQNKVKKSTGDKVVHDLHVIECILRTSQNDFFFFCF